MQYDYSAIGFITFDCLGWPFNQMPEGGETALIDDFALAVSGAAGSAVIAASKMGLKCQAVGGVGNDLMGDWVRMRLGNFDVNTDLLQTIQGGRTSSSIVTTRSDGSRPVLHLKGATGDFFIEEDQFEQATNAKIVHFGGVGLMSRMDAGQNARMAKYAKERGATTTVDVFASSQNDMAAIEQVLPFTDYFLPSIEEAYALTGYTDHKETAKYFLDRGVGCCVFTLGSQGVYYHHSDGTEFLMPAFEVDVRCTCGCGDVFNSGFAVALNKGFEPELAVRFAQAASALNATGLGSQAGVVDFEATLAFMNSTQAKK